MRPKPTRVAIEELQLQDLQKADAAVPPDIRGLAYVDSPIKTIHPEQRVLPIAPTPPVRRGIDSSAPMMKVENGESKCRGGGYKGIHIGVLFRPMLGT